jgi:hypothetical protein
MLTRKLMICFRQVDKIKTKASTSGGTLDILLENLQVQLKMAKKLDKSNIYEK